MFIINKPYRCPNCKTNRTRFTIIEQVEKMVKLNPQTGEIVEEYTNETAGPFHVMYNGPNYRVQCGACGLIENELTFVKYATYESK